MVVKNRLHRSELAIPGSNRRMLEKPRTCPERMEAMVFGVADYAAAFGCEGKWAIHPSQVAGVSAPPGRHMGHAGAIISTESDTACAKMDAMEALGLYVAHNPAPIGQTVLKAMQEHGIKF